MGRTRRRWVEEEFTLARYRDRMLQAYGELGVEVDSARPLSFNVMNSER
jgi:hypothetical protein